MNRSIPKGSHLEFVNITPLNPLISRCDVKVLYAGKNRNRSFITKDVANKMANSLPGTPIVGQYFYQTGDFGDHGEEELVIDENGVRFIKSTVPYGFVAPDAKVWWQNFVDNDGIEREYLLTEGYLWTGRYPDCKRIIEKGNHQSMELDRDTLIGEWSKVSGEWSKIENDEPDYFIINDAVFSALCILGEDVEPCFEGANITKKGGIMYSLDRDEFKEKMLDFMADLKDALNNLGYEGGKKVENLNNPEMNASNVENPEVEVPETEIVDNGQSSEEDFAKKNNKEEDNNKDNTEKPNSEEENKNPMTEKEEEDKKKKESFSQEEEEDEEFACGDKKKKKECFSDDEEEEEEFACGDKKKKKEYSLEDISEYQELLAKYAELEGQFNAISAELNAIKPEYSKLKDMAIEAENKAKEDMINSFYMLSDEDKKEVKENMSKFSLDDIEAKLSVICVRKKVNFDLEDSSKNEDNTETPITTFNVGDSHNSTPAWLRAVDAVAKNRK